jgi:Mn2+/Fe2+ NRAMP family transporter
MPGEGKVLRPEAQERGRRLARGCPASYGRRLVSGGRGRDSNLPAILSGVDLLASGLSSSSVGTMADQVVMQGFINRRIPMFLRRLITMAPALVILAMGLNPSRWLVISQ